MEEPKIGHFPLCEEDKYLLKQLQAEIQSLKESHSQAVKAVKDMENHSESYKQELITALEETFQRRMNGLLQEFEERLQKIGQGILLNYERRRPLKKLLAQE
jgi:uncharacterized alpha-E superfamily protein